MPARADPIDADGLAEVLRGFMRTTEPQVIADSEWGDVVARRAPRGRAIRRVA